MSLCKYKDLFGKPGEGIHYWRVFDIGVIDVLTTIAGAYFISYFSGIRLLYVLPAVFLLGIVVHRLFCVRTKVDRILFPNAKLM
jgi:hypothetical protein